RHAGQASGDTRRLIAEPVPGQGLRLRRPPADRLRLQPDGPYPVSRRGEQDIVRPSKLQAAALGGRTRALLDQSLPTPAHSLGEEASELRNPDKGFFQAVVW